MFCLTTAPRPTTIPKVSLCPSCPWQTNDSHSVSYCESCCPLHQAQYGVSPHLLPRSASRGAFDLHLRPASPAHARSASPAPAAPAVLGLNDSPSLFFPPFPPAASQLSDSFVPDRDALDAAYHVGSPLSPLNSMHSLSLHDDPPTDFSEPPPPLSVKPADAAPGSTAVTAAVVLLSDHVPPPPPLAETRASSASSWTRAPVSRPRKVSAADAVADGGGVSVPLTLLSSSSSSSAAAVSTQVPPAPVPVPVKVEQADMVSFTSDDSKPRCVQCGTESTPQWRRLTDSHGGSGQLMCNSCGLKERRARKRYEEAMREGRVREDGTISRRQSTHKDADAQATKPHKARARTLPTSTIVPQIPLPAIPIAADSTSSSDVSASSSAATSPRNVVSPHTIVSPRFREMSFSNPVYNRPPLAHSAEDRPSTVASRSLAPLIPPPPVPIFFAPQQQQPEQQQPKHFFGNPPFMSPPSTAVTLVSLARGKSMPDNPAVLLRHQQLQDQQQQQQQFGPASPALTSPKRRRRINAEGGSVPQGEVDAANVGGEHSSNSAAGSKQTTPRSSLTESQP